MLLMAGLNGPSNSDLCCDLVYGCDGFVDLNGSCVRIVCFGRLVVVSLRQVWICVAGCGICRFLV